MTIVGVVAVVVATRVVLAAAGPEGARVGLVVDVAAAVAVGVKARSLTHRAHDRRSRLAWHLLTAFPIVWLVAPVVWLVGADDAIAHLARTGAVLLFAGSWWFAARAGGTLSRVRPAVDGGIGAASVLVLAWHGPLAEVWRVSGGGIDGVAAVGLPVAMVGAAVLGSAITVTEMPPGRTVRPTLFVAAMLLLAGSDVAWSLDAAPFWAAGWTVYAMTMRIQVGLTPRVIRVPSRGRLVYLPYALIVPSAVVLALQSRTGDVSPPQVGAGIAIVVLLVVRQHVTLLENDRLVARLEETERLLRHRATHDSLTGLPGRAALHEHLAALAGPRASDARPLTVAFVDVDDFKRTNDDHGHAAGDAVLVEVARRLIAALPHDDMEAFVARLGGDEFAMVVTGEPAADAEGLAVRLTEKLGGPIHVGPAPVQVRVSVGAATVASGEFAPSALLHEADLAMYAVKRGRAGEAPGQPQG